MSVPSLGPEGRQIYEGYEVLSPQKKNVGNGQDFIVGQHLAGSSARWLFVTMPSGNSAHVLGGSSNASTWTVSAGQNAQPFVQQDQDATENDDSAPDPGPKVWRLPEHCRAEHGSPEDLSVVEWRYKRGRREFESPDQAIVPKPAEDAETAQHQRIRPTCRRVPHEGQRQAGQYEAGQNHVGVGRLRGVMPGDLARKHLSHRRCRSADEN